MQCVSVSLLTKIHDRILKVDLISFHSYFAGMPLGKAASRSPQDDLNARCRAPSMPGHTFAIFKRIADASKKLRLVNKPPKQTGDGQASLAKHSRDIIYEKYL